MNANVSDAGKAQALQAAQAYVRSFPQYAHPCYWAAFTLTGDPGTMNATVVVDRAELPVPAASAPSLSPIASVVAQEPKETPGFAVTSSVGGGGDRAAGADRFARSTNQTAQLNHRLI